MKEEELNLLHRYLDGVISPDELEHLEELLRTNPEARSTLRSLATIDAKWQELGTKELIKEPNEKRVSNDTSPELSHTRFSWFSLKPLAAGIVGGVLASSILWALATPQGDTFTQTSQEIVYEDFEDSDIELPIHLPVKANQWCGRLVSVTPKGGTSAFEGTRVGRLIPKAGNRSESLSRIVDLHDYPDLESGYVRSLRVKGSFTAPFTGQNPGFHVRIVAFSQAPEDVRQAWRDRWNSDAMILQGVERKHLPEKDEQGNWHEVSASLEIPEGTRSIMVTLGVWHLNPDMSVPDLYLDAIQVQLVDTYKPPAKPN